MRNRIKPRVKFAANSKRDDLPVIPKSMQNLMAKIVREKIRADIYCGAFYRVRRNKPAD